MYTLQRANVVKLTDSEVKRDKYISEGYTLVEEPVEQTEGQPAALPDEGAPVNDSGALTNDGDNAETEQKDGAEACAKGKVKSGDKKGS